MRLMIVHSRYRQRGGEDAVVDLEIKALRQAGLDILPVLAENGALARMSPVRAGLRALWSVDTFRALRQQAEAFRPDLIHVHNTFPGLSASVYAAARSANLPIVQTLHNFRLLCTNALLLRDNQPCTRCIGHSLPWQGILHGCYRGSIGLSASVGLQAALHRAAAGGIARYIALSPSSRDFFIEGGLPSDRLTVRPNFTTDPGPAPPAEGRHGLLFVGRLSPEKGLDTVLSALSGIDSTLSVIGDGPEAARLKAMAPASVRWLGAQPPERVSQEMHKAALLVFPSLAFETFALVIAEAMAHGLPVLASDRGAMRDIVVPDVTGWLLPPGDRDAWNAALAVRLADPQHLADVGRSARNRYLETLTPAHVISRQMDIYRSVLEERP